jgi:hypothetical protein
MKEFQYKKKIELHTETRFLSPLSNELTDWDDNDADDWLEFDAVKTDDIVPLLLVATSARRFCCHTWLNCWNDRR